jgi:hypothetical protein
MHGSEFIKNLVAADRCCMTAKLHSNYDQLVSIFIEVAPEKWNTFLYIMMQDERSKIGKNSSVL